MGPGAKEAGVTFFIDQQLAGPFGRAETWYMQGPWKEGTPQQGYQLKLTPAQLYRVGIQGTDEASNDVGGVANMNHEAHKEHKECIRTIRS